MKNDIDIIMRMVKKNPALPIIYFWGHMPNPKKMTVACFSQWYDCSFVVDGVWMRKQHILIGPLK